MKDNDIKRNDSIVRDMNRREFLKITAGTGAALAIPTVGHSAVTSKMIGIQVGAVSFVDEGTDKVLDIENVKSVLEFRPLLQKE